MSKREKIISVCALVLLAIAALSLTLVLVFKKETRVKEIYGYFDTVTVLRDFSGASEGEFAERCRCVSDIFESYHRLSDIYNEYKGINNLKTLNDNAGRGAVKIAPELMELLIFAKDIHALTDGEVNVAMGGVLAEWHGWREGMSNGYSPALPSQELLDGLFAHSDIDSLLLDLENMTAELADSEMSLDLGALAKGFATEKARLRLISLGADNFVIDAGGNLAVIGKGNGKGFKVGIKDPKSPQTTIASEEIIAKDISVVTSGDYERYCLLDGVRYHHIIDKDTRLPSEHFSSVTVVTENSALADALSTALFCTDTENGRQIIERAEEKYGINISVIWIDGEGKISRRD